MQVSILVLAAGTLAVPPVVIITSGTAALSAVGTTVRLTGLIAYTLIFWNIVTGSLARYFYRIYGAGRVAAAHRWSGILGFALALLHGVLIIAYDYLPGYGYVWIVGPVTLGLLALTAGVALYRRRLTRVWRNIHRLNYIIFVLIYVKAVSIGTDLVSSGGPYVVMMVVSTVYLGVAAVAFLLKARDLLRKRLGFSRREQADG